jgi:hypothetical protein
MEILFLANRPTKKTQASTVTEYLNSLSRYSKNKVHEISMLHDFPSRIDLNRFDVVITHYSLSLGPMIRHYLGDDLIKKLKTFNGLKAAFLQDEYRETHTYWKHLNDLGFDILFSCVPEHEIPKVYPAKKLPHLRVENVLTGYVPKSLLSKKVLPISERRIDVGYRTRKTPYFLGQLGYEKWFISEEFFRRSANKNLVLDISIKEGERLYGEAWNKFLASCRSIIGVESGASIIDFDGKLEKEVNRYLGKNPKASFREVFDLFLKPHEGSLYLNQISPRCFEAAALKTPMILFEGNYSGILKADRHFIPLKKDFSNFEEVLRKLRDNLFLQKMADRTYKEIALNDRYSYKSFIKKIDQILSEEFSKRKIKKTNNSYSQDEFKWAVRLSFSFVAKRYLALFFQSIILGLPLGRKIIFGLWDRLPFNLQIFLRPFARIFSR